MRIYGYCRISKPTQSIERQRKNLRRVYGEEIRIFEEAFTGTKVEGRKVFNQLLKVVANDLKAGYTVKIVFDSVSRMSRNKKEGVDVYFNLFNSGVELEFLKEPHINTQEYRKALNKVISVDLEQITDPLLKNLFKKQIEGINELIVGMAMRNIELAFEQAEKEVTDLHERTKEGMRVKKEQGIIPGPRKGSKMPRKNKEEKKSLIKKYSKSFNGSLKDAEVMKLVNISHDAYYRYKRELYEELAVEVEAV